jgi:hypothetical protein
MNTACFSGRDKRYNANVAWQNRELLNEDKIIALVQTNNKNEHKIGKHNLPQKNNDNSHDNY